MIEKKEFSVTSCEYVTPSMKTMVMRSESLILAGSTIDEDGSIPGLTDDTIEW